MNKIEKDMLLFYFNKNEKPQAAQAHYVWVRASEVIWSEYTRIIGVLSDAVSYTHLTLPTNREV